MKLTHFAVTGLVLLLAAGAYLVMQTDMDGRMKEMQADYDRKLELIEKAHKQAPTAIANTAEAARAKVNEAEAAAKAAVASGANKVNKTLPDDPAVSEALNNVKATLKNKATELAAKTEGTEGAAPGDSTDPTEIPADLLEKERDILNSSGVGTERIGEESGVLAGDAPPGKTLSNLQSLVVAQPRIARVKVTSKAEQADFVVLDQGSDVGLVKGDSFAVRRGTAVIGRVVIGDTIEKDQCIANIIPEKLVTGMVLEVGDEIIKFDR
jgi:hypothetical protein